MSSAIERSYSKLNVFLSVVIAGSMATVGGIWLYRNAQAFKKSPIESFGGESTHANWKSPVLDPKQFSGIQSKDVLKQFTLVQDQLKGLQDSKFSYQAPKINIPAYQPPRINIPTYQPPRSPVVRH